MVIKQLGESQYANLCGELAKRAYAEPLDAGYIVRMYLNGVEYTLKLQTEKDCKIAALQALRVEREEDGLCHWLITDSEMLSLLLDIVIKQGLPKPVF